MKKLLFVVLLFLPMALVAQKSRTVTGKITSSEDNFSLPGVSIFVDNTTIGVEYDEGIVSNYNIGTVSDIDGNFSIEIPEGVTQLTCSMIGFENYILVLSEKTEYIISMKEMYSHLDEIIVTGYQEIKNRKVTAAITKIEAADIQQNTLSSVDNMLAGQMAGVQSTPTSGAPGAPARIRIRGTASLQGTQDPLWVLDGMPLQGNDLPDMNGRDIDQLVNTSIAGINPSDIESITVLKDAAATAIYGTRASNGVIVITTKKGTKGRMNVNLSTNWFVNMKPDMDRLNLLNSNEKVDLELDLASRPDLTYRNDKGSVARILNAAGEYDLYQTSGFDALSADTRAQINNLRKTDTNWGDELYQTALSQNHNLSISGGTENANYYFSLGYYNEEGTTIGTSMERINLTMKTDFQVAKRLNIGVSLFTNNRKQNAYLTGTDAFTNPSRYSRTANPYLPVTDENGNYVYDADIDGYSGRKIDYNIIEEREGTSNTQDIYNTAAILDLKLDITSDIYFKSQFGVIVDNAKSEQIANQETYYARKEREKSRRFKDGEPYYFLPEGGAIKNGNTLSQQWNLKNMLYYSKTFNGVHDLDVMVGNELRKDEYESVSTSAYGYNHKALTTQDIVFPDASSAKEFALYKKSMNEDAYASFFTTANYSFRDKYSVFASLRYDESNLFGADPKYRYLPLYSAGAAWNIHEENWMQGAQWLTYMKLRASYGLQGNIDKSTSPYVIGEYKSAQILSSEYGESTVVVNNPPNDLLRWEKTSTWNVGLDAGILNNRINVGIDAYSRRSVDLIGPQALPLENGFPITSVNFAEMTNRGVEINLSTTNVVTTNFEWSTSFNIFKNVNKVEEYYVRHNDISPSKKGYSINTIFALPTNGLDEQGYPIFVKDGKDMSVQEFFDLSNPYADWGINDYAVTGLSNDELRGLFKEVGSTDPEWSGGIINNFEYKNWTLNVSANFNIGQWVKETPFYSMTEYDRGVNTTASINSVWSANNTSGIYPAIVGANSYDGERAMEYAWMTGAGQAVNAFRDLDIWYKQINYLRINSIRVGYNVPSELCNKIGIANARVNGEVRNPFVIGSDYDGYFDPESYGNIYAQPMAKSVMLGLNLSF